MASELPPVVAVFDANDDQFAEVVDSIEERLADLDTSNAEPEIGANPEEFDAAFDDVEERLGRLEVEKVDPKVGLDDSEFEAQFLDLQAQLAALDAEDTAGLSGFASDAEALSAGLDDVSASATTAEFDLDRLQEQLTNIGSTMQGAREAVLFGGPEAVANLTELQQVLDEIGPKEAVVADGFDDIDTSISTADLTLAEFLSNADAAALGMDDLANADDDVTEGLVGLGFGLEGTLGLADGLVDGFDAATLSLYAFANETSDFAQDLDDIALISQDLSENVLDLGTAIAEAGEAGLDAELAFQLFEGAGYDLEGAMADAELAIQGAEGAIQDLEGSLADGEDLLQDVADGLDVVEQAFIAGGKAGSGFIGTIANLPGDIAEVLPDIGLMTVMIGGLVAAVIAAIPVIGTFVGALGALGAIAFTGLAGAGAVILGMVGDFSALEAAASAALSQYEKALEPFTKPIENNAILLIEDAFSKLLPIAEQTAPYIDEIIQALGQDLGSGAFATFIDWVGTNAGPALVTIFNLVASIGQSLGEMGEAGQPFINMIEQGIDSLSQDLTKFGDSNEFKDFVSWLVTNGPTVGGDLESIAGSFGHIFIALTPLGLTLLDGFTHFMTIVADIIGPVAAGIEDLAKGFDNLPGPIKDVIDAIAPFNAGFVALGSNWDSVVNDMKSVWDAAWGDIKSAFDTAWAGIESGWDILSGAVTSLIETPIHAAESVWDAAWDGMKAAWDAFWGDVKSGWDEIAGAVSTSIEAPINALKSLWDSVWNGLSGPVDDFAHDVESALGGVSGVIGGVESALNGLKTVADGVGDVVNAVTGAGSHGAAPNATNSGPPPSGKASGGGLGANEPYYVGERGPELFVPDLPGTIVPNGVDLPPLGSGAQGNASSGGVSIGDLHFHGDVSSIDPDEVGSQIAQQVRTAQLRRARTYGQRGGIYGSYAGSR